MKRQERRLPLPLLGLLAVAAVTSPAKADLGIPDQVIRPQFRNEISANTAVQGRNPGLASFPGLLQDETGDPAGNGTPPGDNTGRTLNRVSFGQAFSSFIPYQNFAADVLNNGFNGLVAVNTQLYPTNLLQTSSMIKASAAAFRYKYVMYGPNPDDPGQIVNLFNETFGDNNGNSNPLWGATERGIVEEQLEIIWAALAHNPLDIELRETLLEIFYDRSVAEMQFVRKRLAKLGSIRLGIMLPSGFIIDEEIRTYQEMIAITESTLDQYGELLSKTMIGIDPNTFDSAALSGTPLGYYLFTRAQPRRNQTQSRSASVLRVNGVSGSLFDVPGHKLLEGSQVEFIPERELIPDPENPSEMIPGPNFLPLPGGLVSGVIYYVIDDDANTLTPLSESKFKISSTKDGTGLNVADTSDMTVQVVRPPGIIDDSMEVEVFMGYKDYRHLLTIIAQHIQYSVELARMLGMRGNAGDITDARAIITEIQGLAATDVCLLAGMFPKVDDDSGNQVNPWPDESGVTGAYAGIKTALSEIVNVRGFLNGETNVLGLDRNFLLLLEKKTSEGVFDTYDLLHARLNSADGDSEATGPLAVAKASLAIAKADYETFRGSVDEVDTQLKAIQADALTRFADITGYSLDGEGNPPPAWDGATPFGGGTGTSELSTTIRNINSLINSAKTLSLASDQFLEDITGTKDAIEKASNLPAAVTAALEKYEGKTSSAWTELHVQAGIMKGKEASTQGAYALAGTDNPFLAAGIVVKSVTNTIIQATGAVRTSMREQEIDRAREHLAATVETIDLPLTIQQTILELGALKREQYDNNLAIVDNETALAQAYADRARLTGEAERLVTEVDADRASLSSRYYADPIHFLRAEQAILDADAKFRRAQRWVFYTVRALEYKYQEKFGATELPKTWDAGSVLSMRNATELQELVTQMKFWNDERDGGAEVNTFSVISLRDNVFSPDPEDINLLFPSEVTDKMLRRDPPTGDILTPVEHFRRILERSRKTVTFRNVAGVEVYELRFSTRDLENLGGEFFSPGNYRNKIDQVGVHIVQPGTPDRISGEMIYGGTTYFRTRVPIVPATGVPNAAFEPERDFTSGYVVAPFRYYQDRDFSGNFELLDERIISSSFTKGDDYVEDGDLNTAAEKFNDFKERSVAATGWGLRVRVIDVNLANLEDIKIVVTHNAQRRVQN